MYLRKHRLCMSLREGILDLIERKLKRQINVGKRGGKFMVLTGSIITFDTSIEN